MAMRSIALLLLFLIVKLQTGRCMDHKCNQTHIPENCINNPRIRVFKTNKHYQLQLCSDNRCIPSNGTFDWIRCNDVCKVMGLNNMKGVDRRQCETKVDRFLDNYCANATRVQTINRTITTASACIEPTPVPYIIQNCSASENRPRTSTIKVTRTSTIKVTRTSTIKVKHPTTIKVTVSPTCPPCQGYSATSVIREPPKKGQISSNFESNDNIIALGVLLGLSILLLVIVITGWVCTYLSMKNKKRDEAKNEEQKRAADLHTVDEEERVFNNPTYGGGSMTERLIPGSSDYETSENTQQQTFPRVTYAMYEAVKLPNSQSGDTVQGCQTYDRLDRASVNGKALYDDCY